jgi:hypothetical protein
MNTQETNELQEELNDLEVTPTETQERKDVTIEVTGFTIEIFKGL